MELTYPRADLIETIAVHLLSSCIIGKSNVKILSCTIENLVTERHLAAGSSKLKSSLDFVHVREVSPGSALGFKNSSDNVIGFLESAGDRVSNNFAIQIFRTHGTKLTEIKSV